MADFSTGAELTLEVSDSSLRDAKSTIENELGNLEVDVNAIVSGGGGGRQPRDPSSGRFMAMEGVEQRVVNSNEHLEDILTVLLDMDDKLSGGGFGGGGGGGGGPGGFIGKIIGGFGSGAGKAAGSTTGTTAAGIGTGLGLAGLGIGAGVGLGTGAIQLPEKFNVDIGEDAITIGSVTPDISGPFVEGPVASVDFNPEFNPAFNPTFSPVFEPQFNPEFRPNLDFSPSLDVSPELSADVDFSPSLTIAPTLNLTGIDLSGLSVDLRDEIISSRAFQNQLESAVDDAVADIESRVIRALGGS